MNISEKIKQQRVLLGLSQSEMADKLGISQRVYSNIENGRTKRLGAEVVKAFEALSGITGVDMPSNELIEKLVGLEAWVNVLEAKLISWASKMDEEPISLSSQLKKAKAMEVDRLFYELRQKQK